MRRPHGGRSGSRIDPTPHGRPSEAPGLQVGHSRHRTARTPAAPEPLTAAPVRDMLELAPDMANHKSAIKRIRQTEARTARKKTHRSRLRTQLKTFDAAVSDGDPGQVAALLQPTISLIDKSVQKGVLHRNKGNRMKSKLTLAANRAASGSAAGQSG